ncbi:SDR family NAD(P)-dependent oxidoreductase [Novosphingobium sp.]|uniref:SDR family NAD(P)-dependent oxidoreductase n=1 Tax=Novosphingobium sp. TaxID=1874826 RepID=UPI003D12D9FD
MKRFDGKTAIVTGAASGIGKATAERLASEGADVVLADLNLDGATIVAAAIAREFGVRTHALAFDAGDRDSCRAMVEHAVALLDGLHVLVNNAGIMDWAKAEEYPDDRWERMIRINLSSVFYVSKHALPHLLRTRGAIVNMSSAAGLNGVPYAGGYCAAKAGIIGLTRSQAIEFADRGVRVNAICPGAVDTPLNSVTVPLPDWIEPMKLMGLAPKTGKPSAPAEIAAAVAYLACDEACNVTGTMLSIDGGQTAS